MTETHLLEETRGICVVLDVTTTGAHVEKSLRAGRDRLGPLRPHRRGRIFRRRYEDLPWVEARRRAEEEDRPVKEEIF